MPRAALQVLAIPWEPRCWRELGWPYAGGPAARR